MYVGHEIYKSSSQSLPYQICKILEKMLTDDVNKRHCLPHILLGV